MKVCSRILPLSILFFTVASATSLRAQDWVHTGTNLGNERIRLAAADFKPLGGDPQLAAFKSAFDSTLANDLGSAGIFDMVPKSLAPQAEPGAPQEVNLDQWSASPANAMMLAFGSFSTANGRLAVSAWLYETHNPTNPQVIARVYNEEASQDSARTIAHRFADEIIKLLGGGISGIAETKIFFVSSRSGSKEIWSMDYDGQNQHQVTHLASISISPHVSPDNSRIAFSSLGHDGWSVRMYSLDLDRPVNFPAGTAGSANLSPAWSADGQKLAFSSARSGESAIWVTDVSGANLKKLTSIAGPAVSPSWNPRTNAQIAWVSGQSGLPQIYTIDLDGANIQRMTDGGYAVSPSWAPNGQFLTFSWNRKYGPGAPGGQDIYVMDIASKRWLQLTHDAGSNDYPFWAPDGRHIVFQREINGKAEIWSMLADGTEQRQLTRTGNNFQPNWSWK